ncbi:hypothetical protein [Rhodocyclus purpureus]|uniref:hypothetical protein n=1 Tax=Rhodocyclus purpureus TaxID=1067 RepID=UPI001913C019|nr:hypothetical protein [Rhodocyclus purpureus]
MKTTQWIRRLSMTGAAILLSLFALTSNVSAAAYSSLTVYGDSLSDNGNLFAATGLPVDPYYAGRRSNGPVAVEYLAASQGGLRWSILHGSAPPRDSATTPTTER